MYPRSLNSTFLKRISFIDQELSKRNFPDKKKLAKKYEVSTKTIQRDIEFLKDYFNAPVRYDKKSKGYYYSDKSYRLNPMELNSNDLFALAVVGKIMNQSNTIPFKKDIESLYNKLFYLYNDKMSSYLNDLDEVITFRLGNFRQIEPNIFNLLKNAIKEYKSVNTIYRTGHTGEKGKRLIDPYHIINDKGEWYLIGYCHTKHAVKIFTIHRFVKAEISSNEFTVKNDFNVKSFFENSFGIFETKDVYKVKLFFEKDYAAYITEKVWHKSQKIKENPDGSIILEMKINSLTEIKFWILSWGRGCKVLAPKKLQDMLKIETKAMLKMYL